MATKAVFEGLVFDENDQVVEVSYVGGESCYVVNDAGFRRHISSEIVDLQVLEQIQQTISGNENTLSEQAAKLLGQDDIFSKAMIENQIRHIDQQFQMLLNMGIPEETRAYLGMVGFRVRINLHGEVIDIEQPGTIDPGDDE
jgi:hypothetical protein